MKRKLVLTGTDKERQKDKGFGGRKKQTETMKEKKINQDR